MESLNQSRALEKEEEEENSFHVGKWLLSSSSIAAIKVFPWAVRSGRVV